MHLIDGGLSTELERIGARIEGELWTGNTLLAEPELVELAHRNFVQAGAEIIISSSYQLSRQGFLELGLTDAAADKALIESTDLARAATSGSSCKVAASIGPYGAVLHDGSEYRGDYIVSQSFLEDFHYQRLEVLLQSKPDLLAVETIPNVIEAKALAKVLENVDLPFWICFTAPTAQKLWSGEYLEDALNEVAGLDNLLALGLNCVDPEIVLAGSNQIHALTGIAVIAYPNCGGVWDSAKNSWLGSNRKSLVSWFEIWQDSAIEYLGGCCGVDSTEIRNLNLAMQSLES